VAPAGTARQLTRATALLLVVLLLALAAAVVAAVSVNARLQDLRADERRRQDILQAARQQGVNFTTLDYRSIDEDLDRVLASSTGTFRDEFQAGSQEVTDLVVANQTVSTGEVLEAGIVTADRDSARVLVVADSAVTNASDQELPTRHYRMQIDLVLQRGRWLTSGLDFVELGR
jgi:Mce-associated membrane protein